MSNKIIDLTGRKFGQLSVLRISEPSKTGDTMWLCKCECGNTKSIRGGDLKRKIRGTKTCGHKKPFAPSITHSYTHKSWTAMMTRCNNPNNPIYKDYGAKGITVCERWLDFANFLEDMGERPDNTSIDRIAGATIYSKETCKWSNASEQAFNTSRKSKLGLTGIQINKSGSYSVQICKEGIIYRLGTYTDLEEAKKVRKEAEEKYYPSVKRPK